jgi:hypothetical protein
MWTYERKYDRAEHLFSVCRMTSRVKVADFALSAARPSMGKFRPARLTARKLDFTQLAATHFASRRGRWRGRQRWRDVKVKWLSIRIVETKRVVVVGDPVRHPLHFLFFDYSGVRGRLCSALVWWCGQLFTLGVSQLKMCHGYRQSRHYLCERVMLDTSQYENIDGLQKSRRSYENQRVREMYSGADP